MERTMKLQISLVVFVAAICCNLWLVAEGTKGVDVSTSITSSAFSCLVQQGYEFVVVRAYRSYGRPDIEATRTIRNAISAGFNNADVYMFPCPKCSKSALEQFQEMVNNLNVSYGQIWIDIEDSTHWYASKQNNQDFFEELLSAARKFNKRTGVYASKYQWENIMGSSYFEGSNQQLWYAHFDNNPSFSDFQPFGGWSSPTIKQYGENKSECGAKVDLNYQ